jgi:tRNA G18 (ribose-2'-O)-methylase SpoU
VPYRDLTDAQLRHRREEAEGTFVVEGRLALEAALASPYPVRSVLVLSRRVHALEGLALPAETAVYEVDDDVMVATTGFRAHRGLLALGGRLPAVAGLSLLGPPGPDLVVIVEGVNDQENLGAIFRNAAAFGAGAVLLGPTCCDPLYRRTVRVSLGHALRVPFGPLGPWPAALAEVERAGYHLLALTPRPDAEALPEVAVALAGARVAVVVGAEGPGLAGDVISRCRPVRIPMAAGVDSLNVAVATAVALDRLARLS